MKTLNTIAQENYPMIFGHRGCRGIMPENTIKSFDKALQYNIDGIEWDVVVNKDKQLVISHEEYIDKTYCLDKTGQEIKSNKEHLIYKMNQKEIEMFDCGTKKHPKFPLQNNYKAYKPLVSEAFSKIDYKGKKILFEIKSEKKQYGIKQPSPKEYAEIVLKEVGKFKYKKQIIFMSFDPNILEELNKISQEYPIVYLHEGVGLSTSKILNQISFKPYALGIYYKFITKKTVIKAHKENVKIFAWTVNKQKEFDRLIKTNLDGIITDFPNLYQKHK